MRLQFDTHGNEKQKQVAREWCNHEVTEIIYGGSKGSGKSFLGCSLIFGDAFTYPETHYFIARKKLNDLRKFTIPSIYEVFNLWGITQAYYTFNAQDNYFTLYNGSKVFLLDAAYQPSDPLYSRFGSMQMTRGWVEEAGEFELAAKTNLQASIGRWKNDVYNLPGKLLETCNPAKNYLYGDYKKNRDGVLESWKRFIQALPADNKMLPAGYLENLNRILSANEKERLLFGNWEYDDDPAVLIDFDKIQDLWTNSYVKGDRKYITVDVARYGSDNSVIMVWNGFRIEHIEILQKSSIKSTAEEVNKLRKIHNIPLSQIIADEDGVGGGLVDILGCKGFTNNSSAVNGDNFANLKSQCYFLLADKINNGEIYILQDRHKEALIEELEQVKQKDVDTDGKRAVVSKERVKELIGRSPDLSDCMMFRMYFELNKLSIPKLRTVR